MRRGFTELLMAAGAVMILLIILAVADERVREQLTGAMTARPGQVITVMTRAQNTAQTVGAIVRHESRAHTPLLIFGIAAAVLTVFMLRT
jgi:hypothetical protein